MISPSLAGPDEPPSKAWLMLSLGLLLAATGLRIVGLNHSLWIDEAGSLAQASAPDFWSQARHDVHPPLYFFLLRLGLSVTHSFAGLRLFSIVCGLGLVAMFIVWTRRSLPSTLALGAILVGLPEFIYHSQELRPYSLLLLLLGSALLLAVKIFLGDVQWTTRLGLSAILLVAACTHLITAFFLVALAPLLAWPARQRGLRSLAPAFLPLIPAVLAALWLKFGFIEPPGELKGGWWIPPASPAQVLSAWEDAVGWKDLLWLGDACARRLPGSGVLLMIASILALGFAIWTALKAADVLVWALLAVAGIHIAILISYSRAFEPSVMGRTLLPALLPLSAGLARGVGLHPCSQRRALAAAAMAFYAVLVALPVARRAFTPVEGLRGLAAAARAHYRPGDQIVLFRALDYGLRPYWPDFSGSEPLCLNQALPFEPQLAAARLRFSQLNAEARVLIAYRADYYLGKHPDTLASVLAELSAQGRPVRSLWQENDLFLLLAGPRP